MNLEKIYPLFLQKMNNQMNNQIFKILKKDNSSITKENFRVIISFESRAKREKFIAKSKNLEILNQFGLIPAVNLYLTKQQIENLKGDNLIKRIEEDQKLYLSSHTKIMENLGLYKHQRNLFSNKGKNIIIGIIDNGINRDFDSIKNYNVIHYQNTKKLEKKKENRSITHGTLMANIIASQYGSDHNFPIGVAPEVKLIDFDISNAKESYFFSDILKIFDSINENSTLVDILLISLTTLHPSDGQDILSLACNLLSDNGLIIVCPAGNFGPESYTIGSPSAAEKVITIGALKKKMTIAYYSGRGPTLDERLKPDFCLPGSKIEIPLSNDKIIKFSGTSASAAIGAAIIALIKEDNPDLSYGEILEIIKKSCVNLKYRRISQGFGTPNIMNLIKHLDMVEKKPVLPYNYLIKRSLWITVEFIVILIIIFYLVYFFDLMKIFYNMF